MTTLIIAAALSLAVISLAMTMSYRGRLRSMQQADREQVRLLEQKLDLVNRGAMGVGKRLIAVEKSLQQTRDKQARLEQETPLEMSYNRAIQLFSEGASLEQVMASCQLSHAECVLIERIHASEARTDNPVTASESV